MRLLVASSVAVLALAAAAPRSAQAQCSDVTAIRNVVETTCRAECDGTKKKPFNKCLNKSLKDQGLDKKCKKQIKKLYNASLCGKPATAVVCCQHKGNKDGTIKKKPTQCKTNKGAQLCGDAARSSVAGAFFNSVSDVCSSAGTCNPTPTTTTTTTTTTTIEDTTTTTESTTTTTIPLGPCDLEQDSVEFVTGAPGGDCGATLNAMDEEITQLNCGGLNIGGGQGTTQEGPTPDGSALRFLAECDGDICTLSATSNPSTCWECSTTGCNFGTPLPILNAGLSTCVLNSFASPASGTLNRATGETTDLSIHLGSHIFLTGLARYQEGGGPCPVCSETVDGPPLSGTPENPATGVCDGGPREGEPCTTTNSEGLTNDCKPGGDDGSADLGVLDIDLSPLSTGSLEETAADGNFCPDQANPGCFAHGDAAKGGACRKIVTSGSPAGPLADNTPADVIFASIFCIPETGGIVDPPADLPGPGQVSLTGTLEYIPGTPAP
jgi:hypothetical protein